MQSLKDTIVAISTPIGYGGIGVIRISGPEALEIGRSIFEPVRPDLVRERRLSYGRIRGDNKEIIDQVMAVYIKAPYTYTGQDTYEIQAHGGTVVLEDIVRLCQEKGARNAEPGEFSYRAYMAGKVDLSQAEAVVELINAKNSTGSRLAVKQMMGALQKKVEGISDSALGVAAIIEAKIDFPEEENEEEDYKELLRSMENEVVDRLEDLIREADTAALIRKGTRIVLAGRVNAGKSSLINALCLYDRAIISEKPGTTRDYLEEEIELDGLNVTLIDTAGYREKSNELLDEVEVKGQDITKNLVEEAHLVLYLIDSGKTVDVQEIKLVSDLDSEKCLVVINKIDKKSRMADDFINKIKNKAIVKISALERTGLDELKTLIKKKIVGDKASLESITALPNRRQTDAIIKAHKLFKEALSSIRNESPPEIILVDLKEGLDILGQITGRSITDSILERIFERFCIGK